MATDKWNNPQKYLKLPQGAFSGPSKDDIVNALSLFFGSPSNPEKLADYTQARVVLPPRFSVALGPPPGGGRGGFGAAALGSADVTARPQTSEMWNG